MGTSQELEGVADNIEEALDLKRKDGEWVNVVVCPSPGYWQTHIQIVTRGYDKKPSVHTISDFVKPNFKYSDIKVDMGADQQSSVNETFIESPTFERAIKLLFDWSYQFKAKYICPTCKRTLVGHE